ncbi:MAG TPA: AI-2E family transporter [Alphaproteobacteria bacterium]|nr:AI-2E family transporter [Alphaproteobacteria bacterium]
MQTKSCKTNNTLSNLWNNTNFGVWFVLGVLLCSGLYVLRSVLLPFVLGIILGYLFDPLATKLEKLKISRTWATVLVFLIVVLIAVPVIALLVGVIDNQLSIFVSAVPTYIASFVQKLEPAMKSLQEYIPGLETDNLKTAFSQNISQTFQLSGKFLQGLFKNGMAIVNVLSLLLITPVVAFYMLRDWDVFVKKVDALLPRKSKKNIREIFKKIDKAISGFIRGQLSVCVILGTYYALGLRLIGLELGLLVGFIAGLISFIPYVGSITGFVLSIILALSQFSEYTKIIEVVLVFGIGQFLEGNFLTPKLVGDNIGLHPVWVMFALLAGGVLLGFLGLMIAVPVAAIVAILLKTGIEKYKKSKLYLED